MFLFNGTNQVAHGTASWPSLYDFSVAMWVASTTTQRRALLGSQSTSGRVTIWANASETDGVSRVGSTAVFLTGNKKSPKKLSASFSGSSLYDGLSHLLIVTRDGPLLNMYIDGVPQTATLGESGLGEEAIELSWTPAVGANRVGSLSYQNYCACAVAELAVWNRVLSPHEIASLAAGLSAEATRPLSFIYWPALDGRDRIGGGTWSSSGTLVSPHPQIERPMETIGHQRNPDLIGGYEIYVKKDAEPTPGTDAPVALISVSDLADKSLAAVMDLDDLGLDASSRYCLVVCAVNLVGRSGVAAPVWFETDADGKLVTIPTPVTGLSAVPKAGGLLLVAWTYYESAPFAAADQFRIVFSPQDGQPAVADQIVIATAGKHIYSVSSAALADGDWEITVYSEKDGEHSDAAGSVVATADATPPTELLLRLSAV